MTSRTSSQRLLFAHIELLVALTLKVYAILKSANLNNQPNNFF
jgi:hypothetical protein